MKAVILSAGQGTRLLPLTADNPKCLLKIEGQTIIEWQIGELSKCGIDQVTVVAGYQAKRVEQLLTSRFENNRVKVLFNPTYSWADNLFSCWVARHEMGQEFVLLNGDTLFEASVLSRLLDSPVNPVTVATHKKSHYDTDDMKVSLEGDRLIDIGKKLDSERVDAESIGMILFRGRGPVIFRRALERAMVDPLASKKWYLSVVAKIARSMPVWTFAANGLQWCEVDYPADLKMAPQVVRTFSNDNPSHSYRQKNYAWG